MKPVLFLLFASHLAIGADFPQWRGPQRNGVLADSPKLLDAMPKDGLKQLWESEKIPAQDDGGLSSPIAADGKVYVALVWHRNEPSTTRQINDIVVRQLGWQNPAPLGKELIEKMEKTREGLDSKLRGGKLEEFTQKFIDENLDKKQQQLYAGMIKARFAKGKLAIPFDVLAALDKQTEKVFASEAEMKAWLDAQGWSEAIKAQIVAAVPPTIRMANDAVVCLDLASGKQLWKTELPGAAVGRGGSSTPVLGDGKIFAVASTRVWALDAATGKLAWETPLDKKRGIGSSPMLVDGVLVANIDKLIAFDAKTGTELWKQDKAGGGNASPVAWKAGDKTFVIANGRAALDAVELKTGAVAWSAPGGGDSTPAISGDTLVVQTRKPDLGVVCYALATVGATKRWNFPIDARRTQSSPIISGGAAYFIEDDNAYCFDLATGSQRWTQPYPAQISSPLLADGKIFVLANNGNNVAAIKADPAAFTDLGRANVRAQWVPSPCIADGKLILRMKESVKAWALTP
ncbi:MAG: PQQ-binding-like beta-propeller repeat protein [Chthoniobacteraceae bacterium]